VGSSALVAQRTAKRAGDIRALRLAGPCRRCALVQRAALLVGAEEYEVETSDVLRLSRASGCSAYDCEYVALAEFLDLKLATADAKLIKAFPQRAVALADA
jgi:hypothetical protein